MSRVKRCTRCGVEKPLDEFPPVRRGEPKLQTWCRACFAESNARYYRENRDGQKMRLIANAQRRRSEVQAALIAYLSTHPCIDCGESDVVVLEFDHVRDKVADISRYASGTRSWETIRAEIEKCVVRCANCHRKKTRASWPMRPQPSNGPSNLAARPLQLSLDSALGIRQCRVCGQTKPLAAFPFRSIAKGTRQHICLVCQRIYSADWYRRNRSGHAANVRQSEKARRRATQAFVRDYLATHACVDCGEVDPDVLDFDHTRDKRGELSTLAKNGAPLTLISEEIAKCEVRCANCHRRKTANELRWYRATAAL